MATYAATPGAYRAGQVLTASSEQLIVMLYDGARRFLYQAGVAMRAGDVEGSHNKLSRAEAIIRHLRNTLDRSQGQMADRLYAIYTFSLAHLSRGRIQRDARNLEQVSEMLGQLRDAYAQISLP